MSKSAETDEYKSRLEIKVAGQLKKAGVDAKYENLKVSYTVPARDAKYTPDFDCGSIILEAKGRFGHRGSGGAAERQKLILVKEQNPELDIRIVFQNASLPIYKGSKTSYAKWATDHGFKWSDRGTVPASWIAEMKSQHKREKKC